MRADRLLTVGTLARGLTHEINNPLTYVMTNVDFALREVLALPGLSDDARGELVDALTEAMAGAERVRNIATAPGADHGGDVVLGLAQADWGEVTRRREAGEAEYRAYKDALVGAVVGSMRADHPDWEIVRVEGSTPLTTWRFLGSPSGATYGHYHSVAQMGRYRIGSHTRLRGLLLAGQSVAFPGICGAMMSAYMTCGEVLGAERLIGELPA